MKYILAVSGGVDSMVLLHEMSRRSQRYLLEPTAEFVVAHVDHGIRTDSADDERFVREKAAQYQLPYISTQLGLGKAISESDARDARYAWLRVVQEQYNATAIIMAHHQDDVLETILINLLRGTGWRGICALRDQKAIRRPFLTMSKAEIIQIAIVENLMWREDSTNESLKYMRNTVRMYLMPKFHAIERRRLLELYSQQSYIVAEVDKELALISPQNAMQFSRYFLIMSGWPVAGEILMHRLGCRFERPTLLRIWHMICTGRPNTKHYEAGCRFRLSIRELIVSPFHI